MQRYSRPVVSLSKRISGKGGRIRANIMGKRTDWSARSVITADCYMDVDEIKLNGSWGTNPATVITDEYIEWTAREILAYASFLDAPSIVFKPYGEIASDNLDRLVAAITRIQNEEM